MQSIMITHVHAKFYLNICIIILLRNLLMHVLAVVLLHYIAMFIAYGFNFKIVLRTL